MLQGCGWKPDTSAEALRYIADLHIHSPFSRATSKSSNLAGLAAWSTVKGIDVIGTGDFTHPGWFSQLRDNLQPAEPGFFKLKDSNVPRVLDSIPTDKAHGCRFILTAEISSIYKRHGRVRKIHNILFVPDFESAARINARLAAIGNIESDGRPILGLDARNLLEIVLELAPEGFLVPAHIWTPWFSLFGSKSGFDSIDECFDDLSKHIFALETGLSSDPEMNRLVSSLDRFSLISNSDCHSPGKLGREANLFTCGFNFFSMRDALKNPVIGGFHGTIEFFPEEGKYHHDGHRKCDINLTPQETRKLDSICPVCSKPLTIGVMHRVMELADREQPYFPDNSPRYYSLIPLPEVLGEIFSKGPSTKTVMQQYEKLIKLFDSEFNLLLNVSVEEINDRYSPVLGEAVKRMRKGEVIRQAGFDGEFGVIKVFDEGELKKLLGHYSLFKQKKAKKKTESAKKPSLLEFGPGKDEQISKAKQKSLNAEQLKAVKSDSHHIVVTAGPGTGKTMTLVSRIERLLKEIGVNPAELSAITFTNRAAEEMRERLGSLAGLDIEGLFIGTFHGFCLHLLREDKKELNVVDEKVRQKIINRLFQTSRPVDSGAIIEGIESHYQLLVNGLAAGNETEIDTYVKAYLLELDKRDGIDLSGVVPQAVRRLRSDDNFYKRVSEAVNYLFIDEFQDLNNSQYELVRILAKGCSVFAIGDPDQAIYGFRGSSPAFFHKFIKEFGADTISLVRNYRSAKNILKAAASVIANNHGPDTKYCAELIPEHVDQGLIEQHQAGSPQAEAEFVVQRIEEFMGGISHFSIDSGRGNQNGQQTARSFKDFAVLYRLTQQAEYLRDALERRGIPFQMVNVKPFFMNKEIQPVYYWIRAAAESQLDTTDAEVYTRLLQTFPGVGRTTLDLLEMELPLGGIADFFSLAAEIKLPKAAAARINDVNLRLNSFRKDVIGKGISGAIAEVMEYLRLNAKTPDAKRFIELAGSFGADLPGFAAYLHRNEAATVYDEGAEAVSLMTLHGAKGLEFPVVFMTGLEEGLFPCELPPQNKEEADERDAFSSSVGEERRLFYVGMTRAQETLVLTSAAARPIYGKYRNRPISSFVKEIPASLCESIKRKKSKKKKVETKQMKLF